MDSRWEDLIVVARVARPHGLRGEVILNPETDFAEERFQPGQRVFICQGATPAALVVRSVWFQRLRPVVGFEGLEVIEDVEALAGLELRIEPSELAPLPPGLYYHNDLVGCRVETTAGAEVGTVMRVDGGGDSSRLVVSGLQGEVLIPLAVDICPVIDPARRLIVIEPMDGLIDLNVTHGRRTRRGRGYR
jgi:16S rRNA processing protein RimM